MKIKIVKASKSKVKVSKLIYIKGQIWELAKLQVVRNIEWTNNFKIGQILVLLIQKILEIC